MKILIKNEGQKDWNMVSSFSFKSELELQKLLSESPDLIQVQDLREGAGDLVAVVREFGIPIGSIDLLAFSGFGDIAIIECKLADNPESKRKVIGQVLEYGSAIWGMTYEEMDSKVKQRTGSNLADFVRDKLDDPEWDEETFRTTIESNLRDGNFILVIVVDEINENLTRIIRFINACGNPKFSFAALEMRRFHSGGTEILVPRVDGDDRSSSILETSERKIWDRDSVLKDASEKLFSIALLNFNELNAFCETYSQGGVGYGSGKDKGSITFYARRNNLKASLFSVYTNGEMTINFEYMKKIYSPEEMEALRSILEKTAQFKGIANSDKKFYTIKLSNKGFKPEEMEEFKRIILAEIND